MVARAGAGPSPIPFKDLTAEGLATAILTTLKPETLERAKELGDRIREEKGCEAGAASFHAQLDVDRLRCSMDPNRVAVWKVKTKGHNDAVRLSAFAATVLGDEGLLDVNQLEPYRPCEYPVEQQFMISNLSGPTPFMSTMGSFGSHLLNMPINIGKAYVGVVKEPYKGAKANGWRGFGKGLGTGFGNLLFPKRGLFVVNGKSYGMRALYKTIKKRFGAGTLSFILAAHFAHGFEEAKASTEKERLDVVRRWHELAPDLKLEMSRESTGSEAMLSSSTTRTTSTTSVRREGSVQPPSQRES